MSDETAGWTLGDNLRLYVDDIVNAWSPIKVLNDLQDYGKSVIPGLGTFYLSDVVVTREDPKGDWLYSEAKKYIQRAVRFRPSRGLKLKVRNQKPACSKKNMESVQCHHPEGEGHSGQCVDEKGYPLRR